MNRLVCFDPVRRFIDRSISIIGVNILPAKRGVSNIAADRLGRVVWRLLDSSNFGVLPVRPDEQEAMKKQPTTS